MRVHFIGIGGIGVSALAQYYIAKGDKVSGSDLRESEITDALRKKGAKVYIGKQKAKNVPKNVDLVIYTPATPENNPELKKAKKLQAASCKLKLMSYPEALGELTKEYFTIAVCGTHGKSTTTAMVSLILIKAGLNPTVIIGTKLKEFGDSNFRIGGRPNVKCKMKLQEASPLFTPHFTLRNSASEKILVIEADEYFASFLNYWPKIIVLTTIEKDHLDYYKNLKNILKAFKEFISHLPKNGALVVNKDDKNISKIMFLKGNTNRRSFKSVTFKIKGYSLSQKNEVRKLKKILKMPGEHNIQNALAALTCARVLKIPDKISFKALSKYQGTWRRFEIFNAKIKPNRLKPKAYTLISDYAHHPTEIKSTLKAAKEKFPGRRIILIFQPHQYQRTKLLFKDFVKSFDETDVLILTEIYGVPGREKEKIVSSKDLTEAVQKRRQKCKKSVIFIKNMEEIPKFLAKILKPNDVIIVMGAGDIYNLFLWLHQGKKNNLS